MVSSVYDLDNIWTLDKRYMRVLPPAPPCCSNVTLIGFQSVHFLSDIRHYNPRKILPDTEGQKAVETRKPVSGSAMLSENDLDQKGEM